ncbi:RNB domain-containing ribonuclease [Miltoncostaea marina]|uniref:RNB domain-containing ribonuclease n=1 Tax=Miltoncostaea marina TaxID=2843215 RepID=UPI001C3C477F|nr:RNB domain-containing ribonuclease [Miltoncostaea marina]
MPARPLRLRPPAGPLAEGFAAIRAELGIAAAFPAEAEREAERAAAAVAAGATGGGPRADRRDVALLTIDPEGSRDLDQALAIEPLGDGHRVRYAIADVAAVVAPGGHLDAAARARGLTVYMPDARAPLHPPVLSEGAASLLPGEDRPALLWTIDLDARAEPVRADVERATVRSRRALSYAEAQAAIETGAEPALTGLREVGLARLAREAERGGVSLTVPVQEVVPVQGGFDLRYEAALPVEDWNAQISLLTGMVAGRIMAEGGVALVRTLDPADPEDLAALRRTAAVLGVDWPEGAAYGDVVRALDPAEPGHAAFAARAARLFRGAGYAAWTREAGGAPPRHAAIAAVYTHVTAPLRRLADRVANEIVLALAGGAAPPAWALEALPAVPGLMATAGARARAAERASVDLVESALLAGRVGEEFPAVVIDARGERATVQLAHPAVVGPLEDGAARPGEALRVRLAAADPAARRVAFTRAG